APGPVDAAPRRGPHAARGRRALRCVARDGEATDRRGGCAAREARLRAGRGRRPMSIELEDLRRRAPEWDELRERRVLSRVLAMRAEGETRRRRIRTGAAFAAGVAVA